MQLNQRFGTITLTARAAKAAVFFKFHVPPRRSQQQYVLSKATLPIRRVRLELSQMSLTAHRGCQAAIILSPITRSTAPSPIPTTSSAVT
jgi:hypothetical protein